MTGQQTLLLISAAADWYSQGADVLPECKLCGFSTAARRGRVCLHCLHFLQGQRERFAPLRGHGRPGPEHAELLADLRHESLQRRWGN